MQVLHSAPRHGGLAQARVTQRLGLSPGLASNTFTSAARACAPPTVAVVDPQAACRVSYVLPAEWSMV